jgi:integrase
VKGKGADPAADKKARRQAETVAELSDLYWSHVVADTLMTRHRQPKKTSTKISDYGRIERHIKPLLGRMKVAAVTSTDIEAFMHDVAAGKTAGRAKTAKKKGLSRVRGGIGTASRTVGLLGGIFTFAVKHRMRPDNPVRGVMRPKDGTRERRLSDGEYAALGAALRFADAQHVWPPAIAVGRFLTLTGWRSGEALNLRWQEVDLERRTVILPDTKTGRSIRPLSHAACDVLRAVPRIGDLVFPAPRTAGRMVSFPNMWASMTKSALPRDVTPHVLRHSYASLAADLGFSEPTIAALVGHKAHSVTSRYLHRADAVLLAAADSVAQRTMELMGETRAEVGQLRPSG